MQKIFPSHFLAQTFQFRSSIGFSWNLNNTQDVYEVNSNFIPLFGLAENWAYWQSPSMLIKWDFSIRIIDPKHLANRDRPIIPCCHMVIYVRNKAASFSGISTVFSLLDSIEGFLFAANHQFSNHRMLFQAWKMFKNNFDKNKKCSSHTICLE